MPRTPKLFRRGRSQPARLPSTGDIALSRRPSPWEEFFEMAKDVPKDFMSGRGDQPPQKRALFQPSGASRG